MPTGRATQGTILIVLGLVSNTPPLVAADSDMTQEYLSCMDKSNGNNAAMTDCISAETARQDARLNENNKRLISKVSTKRKNTLLEAQRAWVKFGTRTAGSIPTQKAAQPRSWTAGIVFYRQQLNAQKNQKT